MPKEMAAQDVTRNSGLAGVMANLMSKNTCRDLVVRHSNGQEDSPMGYVPGSVLLKVHRDGMSHRRQKRKLECDTRLRATDSKHLIPPVDVL
jgi:hypothetical protein